MSKIDLTFQELCKNIKNNGRKYANKNRNVERLQITSNTFKHDMRDGFPAITNKKLPFKFVKGELIWFLRGDTDVRYLNDNGIPIWNKDAYNWYLKEDVLENINGESKKFNFEEFVKRGRGSVGQNYSAQWRNYNGNTDQIAELIQGMREDIMSSRLKVEAWNPSEINKTALPPCHTGFQIIGVPLTDFERKLLLSQKEGWQDQFHMIDEDPSGDMMEICDVENIPKFGFELHWNQRSVDTFLGLPFNIASYATLGLVLQEITEYPFLALEGALKCVHFYDNQYEAVDLLLERNPEKHKNSKIVFTEEFYIILKALKKEVITLDEFFKELRIDMIIIEGYTSDEEISVEMLAPKTL